MLEKCLRQYEHFYVKLIERRILDKENSVGELFDSLTTSSMKENYEERTKHLEKLLHSKLNNEETKDLLGKEIVRPLRNSEHRLDILHLYVESVDQSDWEEVLKVASSLLVELSTFPTYFLPGDGMTEEEPTKERQELPEWLKVLIVCACWLGKQPSLQLTTIATLLDLIALSKVHSDAAIQSQSGEGITTVVIVPLLKHWHVTYLRNYTNVFQVRKIFFFIPRILIC